MVLSSTAVSAIVSTTFGGDDRGFAPPAATVTVNAAFLREIKDDNLRLRELLAEIDTIATEPLTLRNHRRELAALLAELRDQLAMHFTLEEAYGYFSDPIEIAPRLCERADNLRNQHGQLHTEICDVAELMDHYAHKKTTAGEAWRLVMRLREFLEDLADHESAENELIMQAYSDDIGVGD